MRIFYEKNYSVVGPQHSSYYVHTQTVVSKQNNLYSLSGKEAEYVNMFLGA